MSQLRHQLQSMRDAYHGETYPGDLATEILAPPRRLSVGRFAAAASAIAGVAAALALWVSLDRAVAPVAPAPTGEPPVAVVAPAMTELATIPALPDDLPALPEAESMLDIGSMSEIGAMPAMPSMDLNFSFDDPDVSEDSV